MFDWIIEIFEEYQSSSETYYQTLFVFDEICIRKTQRVNFNEIYKIGVTSLIIATKMDCSSQLCLNEISRNITHNKFSVNQLIFFESQAMDLLQYRILR